MPRKPSAAIPRSETTAQLIARICAERDEPMASGHRSSARSGTGVLNAPAVGRRLAPRIPAQRMSALPGRRAAEDPGRLPPRPAGELPAVPTRPRGDDLLVDPRPAAPASPIRRRAPVAPVSDDVLCGPAPDDTPTVVIGYVAPAAPRRRNVLVHRLVPLVVGAAAMIVISIATAHGFALPGFTDPGPLVRDTGAVVANPPAVGPTVPAPAPVDGTTAGPTVPAPAAGAPADPQSDVTLTDAAVPAPGY